NHVASIGNITQVYNEEQKFPEMDAYCISKIYADWTSLGKVADTTVITTANVLEIFDMMMERMTEARVPENGRILYVTPVVNTLIKNAKEIQRTVNIKDGGTSLNRQTTDIDTVKIIKVPSNLMKTAYDFTTGWKVGAGAKQIFMSLVHPSAIITPVSYQFSKLDEPTAVTEGKYFYFEESFEDVFILNKKADAIQFVVEA
ncbi:TPA: capsid protein, partial [Clostridioides difficile]|nr:capsid protein [Clostridioides difficile]